MSVSSRSCCENCQLYFKKNPKNSLQIFLVCRHMEFSASFFFFLYFVLSSSFIPELIKKKTPENKNDEHISKFKSTLMRSSLDIASSTSVQYPKSYSLKVKVLFTRLCHSKRKSKQYLVFKF